MDSSPTSSKNIDLRVILETPLRQFVPWLAMVLLVTWAGYPGVVCVTPMAWLMALRVGNSCVARSRSTSASRRLAEAALAGGIFGFLQGCLFGMVTLLLSPIEASERIRAIILILAMTIAGIFAGAIFSFFTAYFSEQRRNREIS
jgi:hypothetical protein